VRQKSIVLNCLPFSEKPLRILLQIFMHSACSHLHMAKSWHWYFFTYYCRITNLFARQRRDFAHPKTQKVRMGDNYKVEISLTAKARGPNAITLTYSSRALLLLGATRHLMALPLLLRHD